MTPSSNSILVNHFTTGNYTSLLKNAYDMQTFARTFALAAAVTLLSLVLAYPIAYHLSRSSGPWQGMLLLIVLAPLLVGDVIRSYGWMILLSDTGLINSFLLKHGVIGRPLPLMYNFLGVGVGLVHIFIPFMVLTVAGALQTIDPDLEHMARSLGAGATRTFRQITWPLSLPGVYAGSILVFVQALGAYAIPTLLGGLRVMTAPLLVTQTALSVFNWPLASAMAFILFATCLAVLGVYSSLIMRRIRELGK
jgi:putative spermidine/putrescine transport system permease protein